MIQEPLVGLTGAAQADVISNFAQKDSQCRFPAFWTSHNDYLPDLDNGGAAMTGLQFMLMQCNGNEIRALPSWPLTWDVDMKLRAPGNTTVRLKFQSGAITQLEASPVFRTNDVILPAPPTLPPPVPTGLTAIPGNMQVTLNWSGSGTAASYNIKRSLISGPFLDVATNVRSTSYIDTGLTNGLTYRYVVSAVNALGQSADSSQVSAIPTPVVISASSENPPNETAAKAFDGSTSTKWYNANGGNTGWLQCYFGGPLKTVARYSLSSANDVPGRDPKNWQFQSSFDGNIWTTLDTRNNETFPSRYQTKQYIVTNATAFAYYRLNITANNGDASGLQLSEMAFIYLDAPTNFTATTLSSNQIKLVWNASLGANSYNIKRATTAGGPYTTIATNVIGLTYTSSNLDSGTVYYFIATAANNAFGESPDSLEVSAQTISLTSSYLAFNFASNGIQFNWPSDHIGWRLEAQTNPIGVGLGTNWKTIFAAMTNQTTLPIDISNGSVFYRLIYP